MLVQQGSLEVCVWRVHMCMCLFDSCLVVFVVLDS